MNSLTIRKKSLNTWVHNDSILGDFIISKFYFNSFYNEFQIVEEGNSRLNKYAIGNITLYDDTDGGTPETFSTITELSLRLEELQYPAFDRTGMTIFPTMEQITNVNVTDIEDGQVLVWNASTSKWINTTIGGLTTPSLTEVLMVGNREVKQCDDLENPAYTFIAEDKSKYCYSISNSEFILDLANFNSGDEIILNNSNGSDFTITSADGTNIVVGSSLVDTVTLPDGYTGYFKNFEGTSWIFTKTTGMDITPPSTEPIVVSSNVTAILNRVHNVVANATITDPTPTEGMGYSVNVINGVATVGGVAYSVGTQLFRHYHSGSWRTFVYFSDANSYSTTEKLTGGKWIDNKPIYRKVIEYTFDSSGLGVSIPHGITDLENIVKGVFIEQRSSRKTNLISQSPVWGDTYITDTNVEIENLNMETDITINIILEYTKTT